MVALGLQFLSHFQMGFKGGQGLGGESLQLGVSEGYLTVEPGPAQKV